MASLQKKIVKGIDYWYIVESFRDNNGKVKTQVLEYIGNTKKLKERFSQLSNKNLVVKSFTHGATTALLKMAEKLEIEKIFEECFPNRIMWNST